MSENTKIEWADHTFNPWEGCQKVSPGCDHCYAEARNARFGGGVAVNWGAGAPRRLTSGSNWRKPVAWNSAAEEFQRQHGRRQRVFCASLADVFDNQVPKRWRADLYALRATDPRDLWLHSDPVGPENDRHLQRLAIEHDLVVCAWGANARSDRAATVRDIFSDWGARIMCLGVTKRSGAPRHPLYVPSTQPLVEWKP